MNSSDFHDFLWELKEESSSNTREEMIASFISENPRSVWEPGMILLVGQRFSDNGIALKTAQSAASTGLNVSEAQIEELYSEYGTLTQAIGHLVEHGIVEYEPQELSVIVDNLQDVAEMSGDAQESRLANIFATLDPIIVAFGVLSEDFKVQVTKKTVANAVAPDGASRQEIERARGIIPDAIEHIDFVISEETTYPPELTVGESFDPMKAKKKEEPSDGLEDWVAQMKIDGYRLLLHISNGEATAFTRKREDVTHSLPELDDIDWPAGEFILDCECVAYEDGERLGYTETSKRIGRKHNISSFTTDVHFELFDCLYANEDIADRPFGERYEVLQSLDITHEFVSVIENIDDIARARAMAEEESYEGVIVKDLTAPYRFDKRSMSWRKLKFTDATVDLLVTSFEQGTGDDAGTLGRMGLETSDGEFMGYVGNGWTEEQQDEIWENRDEYYGEVAEILFEGLDDKLRFPVFKNWRPDGEADSRERVENIGEGY